MSSRSRVSFSPKPARQLARQQGNRRLISKSRSKSRLRSQAAQNASKRSIRSVSVERVSYSPVQSRSVRRMNSSRGMTIYRALPKSQYVTAVSGSIRRKSPSVSVHRGIVEIKSPGKRNVVAIQKSRKRVNSVEYE